jgi:hypothetical protein
MSMIKRKVKNEYDKIHREIKNIIKIKILY